MNQSPEVPAYLQPLPDNYKVDSTLLDTRADKTPWSAPLVSGGGQHSTGSSVHGSVYTSCGTLHDGSKVVISFEDGTTYAGAKGSAVDSDCVDIVVDFADLVGAGSPLSGSDRLVTGLTDEVETFELLRVKWPDMGIPPVRYHFWRKLHELCTGKRVVFCCMGSHGRTGTGLASVLISVGGMVADKAVETVRKYHCLNAVESEAQYKYLAALDAHRLVLQNKLIEADAIREYTKDMANRIGKLEGGYHSVGTSTTYGFGVWKK